MWTDFNPCARNTAEKTAAAFTAQATSGPPFLPSVAAALSLHTRPRSVVTTAAPHPGNQ